MVWNPATPTDTQSSREWDDELRTLKGDLDWYLRILMDQYPASVAARPGIFRAGYRGLKADLPASAPPGVVYYVAETDHLYARTETTWIPCYPPGGGDQRDALRLLPGRGFQADAHMYGPGDVIADDIARPDYAPLPGYRALMVGRPWVGGILYTVRACFTFDLSAAPTSAITEVYFAIDLMETPGVLVDLYLDILPGGPGPTPLAFHHASDPALAILGTDKIRLAAPPFTTTPATVAWDITPHYLAALPARGLMLRLRVADETTIPPAGNWAYGIASADVAGREPRLIMLYA